MTFQRRKSKKTFYNTLLIRSTKLRNLFLTILEYYCFTKQDLEKFILNIIISSNIATLKKLVNDKL